MNFVYSGMEKKYLFRIKRLYIIISHLLLDVSKTYTLNDPRKPLEA